MKPCTPHAVLGTAPSIVLGRHFYAASTIRRSAFGVLHTFILGLFITNTSHEDGTKSLLRQVMALWYRHFIIYEKFGSEYFSIHSITPLMHYLVPDAHVPEIVTQEGLLDVIAVGCILEFASVLNRDYYSGRYDPEDEDTIAVSVEAAHARTRFRVIMKTFAARYTTVIGEHVVHPSYIWNRLLVQFGAAIVTYMQKKTRVAVKSAGVTAPKISAAVKLHLQTDHPHLLVPFQRELKVKPTALTWDGPPIQIIPRSRAFEDIMNAVGFEEAREWPDRPIYAGGDDSYYQGDWSTDDSDSGDEAV